MLRDYTPDISDLGDLDMDSDDLEVRVANRWGCNALCAQSAIRFVRAAAVAGTRVHVTSGYRSPEEQGQLYRDLPKGQAASPADSEHSSWPAGALDFGTTDRSRELATQLKPLAEQSGFSYVLVERGTAWHLHCEA